MKGTQHLPVLAELVQHHRHLTASSPLRRGQASPRQGRRLRLYAQHPLFDHSVILAGLPNGALFFTDLLLLIK
jgi:hypothetical protein